MSLHDFCQCTPSEFQAIHDAWHSHWTHSEHSAWERTRMESLCTLQPHSKKKLKARDVMEFRWDKDSEKAVEKKRAAVSDEEIAERYAQAKARYGLK